MAKKSSTSPHIANPNAPLEQLANRALQRFGDMSPSTVAGEVMPLFIDYANSVVDDLHKHPYWDKGVEVPYYQHPTEQRPIPDHLMVSGLLYRYALDQGSAKSGRYEAEYYDRMNTLLATRKFGVGAEFELKAVDYTEGGVK